MMFAEPLTICRLCLIGAMISLSSAMAADPETYVTGPKFTRQLNRPVLASLDYTPLRRILNRLSEDRHLCVSLDRRIDPGQLLQVEIQADYFDTGIAELVQDIPADVTVVADTVFVTTPDTARTIRTRIALAEKELEDLPKADLTRQLELSHRRPLSWERLTTPREILQTIAGRYEITIDHLEEFPHDLWPAGGLSHPNFIEALLLITCQFDLEFEWIDPHHVRLIPQTPDPVIMQKHVFRGRTKSQALKLIRQVYPDLKVRGFRDHLTVTALLEQQEDVAVLLGNRQPRKASVPVVNAALANRRFTLKMEGRPFLELVEALEKQGIQFHRHEQLLAEAGIDLKQPISLDLENATIETLLSNACKPLHLTFEIDGTRIDLAPALRLDSDE